MKISKCLVLLLMFAAFSKSLQAQSIKGYIYDSQSQQPLENVTIKDSTGTLRAKSAKNGYFEIQSLPQKGSVSAKLVGYKTQIIKYQTGQALLNIQMEADEATLNEVRVVGFAGNRSIKETAGSIAVITAAQINRGNALSFQGALNSIPGVRMDQSTLSEARIAIRGNGVRSSYGIRSIKIYLNDIPITEADGTTRIEALDVNSIGRAEVIKGPASSIYGAGTGGVINFQLQRSPYQEESLEGAALVGSYGLHRLATTYRSSSDKLNSYVSYGWQEYNGYREHSKDMRRFLSGNFQLFPDSNRIITVLLNRTTQYSQIPGSLTQAQVAENPEQANASNLDKKAGRYQTWTRVGLGQEYTFNPHFSNSSSVFTYFYDLNHPLPYAYLRNYYQSYGGRTKFSYDPQFNSLPTVFIAGAEFNEGLTKANQFVNNQGSEGLLNGNMDYRNTLYSVFFQSESKLAENTIFTFGLSYNGLKYDISNYLAPQSSGIKDFKPQASPRVALSHNFGEALSLHASVSTGFAPPSSSEVKDVNGSINPNLQAEKAINYEINAKGNFLASRFSYDLAVFKLDMKNELIAQSVQQSITIYNNAGKTTHRGIELALSWQALKEEDHNAIAVLRPTLAITYSDFKFKDYKTLDANNQVTATFDGNALTGISPWVVNAGLDLEARNGLYAYVNYYFNDKMPLNDRNTDFNPAYNVINSKLGYRHHVFKSLELNLFGGIDNISNTAYSSIVSLNAVAYGGGQPAYYNPSPKRNGYGGFAIKYFL
jgi:iron complex outermembrane receptor protein